MRVARFYPIRLLAVFVSALAIFTFGLSAAAQIPSGYVQTTATVPALANATYGAAWTNLSSSTQLGLLGCVSTFQQTVNGKVNSYGTFTTLLADTAQICPSPSTWTFTFTFSCPAGQTPGGFTVAVAVTGGGTTEDISSQIAAALPATPCGGAIPSSYVSKTQTTLQTMAGPLAWSPTSAATTTLQNLSGLSTTDIGTQTMAGQLNSPSFNGVLNAALFSGVDIGAKINAATATCPSNGCSIYVPPASTCYSFSTSIVLPFNGVDLEGGGNQATCLQYTGAGTAVEVQNWSRISNIKLYNASGAGTGLLIVGAYSKLDHVTIQGFALGETFGNDTYLDAHDHVILYNNTQDLLYPSGLTNSGEHITFSHSVFIQTALAGADKFPGTCVQINGGDITFDSSSFDECGINLNGTGTQLTLIAPHFEDINGTTSIPFVTLDTTCSFCTFNSFGGQWLEDAATTRTSFVAAKETAANVGIHVTLTGGLFMPYQTVTQLALDSSNCCAQGEIIGVQNSGGGASFTNLFGGTWFVGKITGDLGNITASTFVGGSVAINGGTAMTANHGTGTSLQHSDGTGTSGHFAIYDANGNVTNGPAQPTIGYSALVSGTVTVSNAAACTPSATCVYKLTNCGLNSSTAVGTLSIGTVVAGTSFIINSESATATVVTGDTSNICWQIN